MIYCEKKKETVSCWICQNCDDYDCDFFGGCGG